MSNNNNNKNNKYVVEENPYKINGKQYMIWLLFGGFMTIGGLFFAVLILTISIIGIGMSTQIYDLASYIFSGADVHVEPDRNLDKTKNTIWACLFGWMFYAGCMVMFGIFHITYIGRKIAMKWKELAKVCLFPFGLDLRVREK